jgi:hypothetical protein
MNAAPPTNEIAAVTPRRAKMARFAPSTGCPRSGGSSGFIGAWRLRLDLAIDVLSSEPS